MNVDIDHELLDTQRPEWREASLDIARLGAVDCLDMASAPLSLLLAVLREFHRHKLSYCYWKSSRRVREVLAGESDLDLLVAREDQHRAQMILLGRGLKLFPDTAGRAHPAVSSYLGYDEPSGRIIHLHLHFRLIVGEPLFKNYRLPWEAGILERAILHPILPIRVLDAATETLLLVVRSVVDVSRTDPVSVWNRAATKRKFELDRRDLVKRLDPATLRQRAGEVFATDTADSIVEAVFWGRPIDRNFRLRRCLRRELAAYRSYNLVEARLRAGTRAALWVAGNLNKRFLCAPRPWNRRAPGGGRVVALIGVDGSGKSTVATAIRTWLGSEIDVIPLYFGTGDGRPSLLLRPLKMMVPMISRLCGTKPKGASHGRVSDRVPGRLYSLLMMVWATAVALEKRGKLRAAQRGASRGLVVVADRYPQDEDAEYNDGPLLPRLMRVPRQLRLFEARAYKLAKRFPPDLVLKLEVTPETAKRREPEMDMALIRKRVEAARGLAFSGARVVRVDAERPLPDVIRSVKQEVWKLL